MAQDGAYRPLWRDVFSLFGKTNDLEPLRCPDCEESDPIIDEATKRSTVPAGARLLEVLISRDRWKVDPGQAHPFRKLPLGVSGIPTLVRWDFKKNEPCRQRVSDSEFSQVELVHSFFEANSLF